MKQVLTNGCKETRKVIEKYRSVFGTRDGRTVFTHMLQELGFFDPDPGNDFDRGQQDFAKRLLRLCGVWDSRNTRDMVDAFFKITIKPGTPGH